MPNKWYDKNGEQGDVVISSRIRLARNLNGYPFPHLMSLQQKNELASKVKAALDNSNSYIASTFKFINMAQLSVTEANSLVERHLVSPAFADDRSGRYLAKCSSLQKASRYMNTGLPSVWPGSLTCRWLGSVNIPMTFVRMLSLIHI